MSKFAVETVKIGRKTHQIKSGDYILYNGESHQFVAGDGRVLKYEGMLTYTSLVMPKTLVKKIPFLLLKKYEFTKEGMNLVKWYF